MDSFYLSRPNISLFYRRGFEKNNGVGKIPKMIGRVIPVTYSIAFNSYW